MEPGQTSSLINSSIIQEFMSIIMQCDSSTMPLVTRNFFADRKISANIIDKFTAEFMRQKAFLECDSEALAKIRRNIIEQVITAAINDKLLLTIPKSVPLPLYDLAKLPRPQTATATAAAAPTTKAAKEPLDKVKQRKGAWSREAHSDPTIPTTATAIAVITARAEASAAATKIVKEPLDQDKQRKGPWQTQPAPHSTASAAAVIKAPTQDPIAIAIASKATHATTDRPPPKTFEELLRRDRQRELAFKKGSYQAQPDSEIDHTHVADTTAGSLWKLKPQTNAKLSWSEDPDILLIQLKNSNDELTEIKEEARHGQAMSLNDTRRLQFATANIAGIKTQLQILLPQLEAQRLELKQRYSEQPTSFTQTDFERYNKIKKIIGEIQDALNLKPTTASPWSLTASPPRQKKPEVGVVSTSTAASTTTSSTVATAATKPAK